MRQERNEPAGKRRIALYKSDPKQQRPSKHSPGQTKTDEGGCKKNTKQGDTLCGGNDCFALSAAASSGSVVTPTLTPPSRFYHGQKVS